MSVHLLHPSWELMAGHVLESLHEPDEGEWLQSMALETPNGTLSVFTTAYIDDVNIGPLIEGSVHAAISLTGIQLSSPVDAPDCFPEEILPEATVSFAIVPALAKNQELTFVLEDSVTTVTPNWVPLGSPCTGEEGFDPIAAALDALGKDVASEASLHLGEFLKMKTQLGSARLQWRTPDGAFTDWTIASAMSDQTPDLLVKDGDAMIAPLDLLLGGPHHSCVPAMEPLPILERELPSFGNLPTGPLPGDPSLLVHVHRAALERIAIDAHRAGLFCHQAELPTTLRLGDLPVSSSLKNLFGEDAGVEVRIQPITPPQVNLGDKGEGGTLSVHLLFGRIRTEVFAIVNGNPIRIHVMDSAASVTLGSETSPIDLSVAPLAVLDVHTSKSDFDGSPFGPPPGESEALTQQVLKQVFSDLLTPVQSILAWSPLTVALEPMPAFRLLSDHAIFPYRSPPPSP
jgi:hypothetical protein